MLVWKLVLKKILFTKNKDYNNSRNRVGEIKFQIEIKILIFVNKNIKYYIMKMFFCNLNLIFFIKLKISYLVKNTKLKNKLKKLVFF